MARKLAELNVEGVEEVDAALRQFSKGVARGVVRRALVRSALLIQEGMEAHAPYRTDILFNSFEIRFKRGRGFAGQAARKVYAEGGSRQEAIAAMRAASRESKDYIHFAECDLVNVAPHAHLQEFGTKNHAPQPFGRPGWDDKKEGARRLLLSALWEEIEKAAARAARKAKRKSGAGG